MINEPPKQPHIRYDQRGQTVYGNQTNIAGDQHIHLAPLAPSAATAPAPPKDFVGREEQLTRLAAMLTAGKSAAITALHGMGGIGKTALAQQLADQLKTDFPGGIFWADLALHIGRAETILRAWGAICGVDLSQEPDPVVLSERLRGLLVMRRETNGALLVVLDDVRREWLEVAQLLQKSIPTSTPMLMTMREIDLAIPLDAEVVRLDVLPEADAHDLLAVRVNPKAILTPETTIQALLQHLGYLPLAIRLAAGYISKFARKPGFALEQFVDDVAQRAMSLLDAAGGAGLAATFAISYDALSAEQQRVFRYCSIYSPPLLTIGHMAGLLGMAPNIVETALDELVAVALLEWDQTKVGQYRLHPLLTQYAYFLVQEQGDVPAIHKQAAMYLEQKLADPTRGGTPHEALEVADQWEKAKAWETFAQRASGLVTSLARLGYWQEIEQRLICAQTAITLLPSTTKLQIQLWTDRGHIADNLAQWQDAINFYQEALNLAIKGDEKRSIAETLGNLGNAYLHKGELQQANASYEQSLILLKELNDVAGIAGAYGNLGILYSHKGEWTQAINLFLQALAIDEQMDDQIGIASGYTNLATVYKDKGDWEQAITYYEKSLAIDQQLRNKHGIAQNLGNLGSVYSARGEWERAIEFYELSLTIKEEIGDTYGIGVTYGNLGLAYQNREEREKAFDLYQRSLTIKQQLGDLQGISVTYGNLGNLYQSRGEWERAIYFYNESAKLAEMIEDLHGVSSNTTNLGNVYAQKGELDKAIDYLNRSLVVKKQMDDLPGIAQVYDNLGNIYLRKSEWRQALNLYEQALSIEKQLGNIPGIATTYNNLGNFHLLQENWVQARDFFLQSLELKEQLGDVAGVALVYGNLGITYQHLGNVKQALDFYQRSITLKKQLGNIHGLALTYGNLGILSLRQGNRMQASKYLAYAYLLFEELGAALEAQQAQSALVEILGSPETVIDYLDYILADKPIYDG